MGNKADEHFDSTGFLRLVAIMLLVICTQSNSKGENSVARKWMETALRMVQLEGGGPTIHSRNLFHLTIGMYDAWACYHSEAQPYLLGNTIGGFDCQFDPIDFDPALADSLSEVAINFAAMRILFYRFNLFGSKGRTIDVMDSLTLVLGFDSKDRSLNYQSGSAAALGNYIADRVIEYGLQDGSYEIDTYESRNYRTINPNLHPDLPGIHVNDPNRWQPIYIRNYLEKKGLDASLPDWSALVLQNQEEFLSPEWGEVDPFSLSDSDKKMVEQYHRQFPIYLDPGPPPVISDSNSIATEAYRNGFLTNVIWASHLDPSDSIYIDISPGKMGNTEDLPDDRSQYMNFYELNNGGEKTTGHKKNPYTKKPYDKNLVLRGDYTRVIAEFWVDAINSSSPPGHWIKTFHQVSDHPLTIKKWQGRGRPMTNLDWDIKSYLVLTGAMHDAAIAAWSIKGFYDYVRPITAIRWMAGNGQSSDSSQVSYHRFGLPLIPGKIEIVAEDDELVGENREHMGKIKLFCWRGPDYIDDPQKASAKVGWILGENWWPYQRYSISTPPFAGYISGHSTFSTAAAEVLTKITGDPFFPGGLFEFRAKKKSVFYNLNEDPAKTFYCNGRLIGMLPMKLHSLGFGVESTLLQMIFREGKLDKKLAKRPLRKPQVILNPTE